MMPVLSLITYPDMLNTEGCLLNSQLPRSAIKMINKEQLYQQFCSFSGAEFSPLDRPFIDVPGVITKIYNHGE